MDKCREAFESTINEHKSNIAKDMADFGEHKRIKKLHDDVDSEAHNYEWYFTKGAQSRQAEFDAMTEALLNQTQLLAKQKAEVDQLKGLLEKDKYAHNLYYENANLQTLVEEKDKRIEELEGRLKAVHALARMRSAVITADRWFTLKPHIKNAIKCLDRKEKALRGEYANF